MDFPIPKYLQEYLIPTGEENSGSVTFLSLTLYFIQYTFSGMGYGSELPIQSRQAGI